MTDKNITFVMPSMETGGAERVMSILVNSAAERGFNVTLVVINRKDIYYELSKKVKVTFLEQCIEESGLEHSNINKIKFLRKEFKSAKPDIIVSFLTKTNMFTRLASLGLGIPVVASERNDPKKECDGILKCKLRDICYVLNSGMVFQTEDAKDYFKKNIRKKAIVISNPVKEDLPEWEGVLSGENFIAVGRLEPQKNYQMMIEAFSKYVKRHPEAKLTIYGDGTQIEELTMLVKDKGLESAVTFAGVVKDVHNMTKTASVYLMSSDYEGIPNALLESMAMGMPCISTDCPCGGVRSLIKDGENGFMVPVGDSDAMFNKMEQVMGMGDKINEISKAARTVSETNSEQKICDEYFKYFKKFIS